MPSIKGEQTVKIYPNPIGDDSIASANHVSVTSMSKEEPNFPINSLLAKHLSQNQSALNALQQPKLHNMEPSNESINERRS